MTSKEIEELQEKVYGMSNSMLPLNSFFNDIRDNPNENYDKEFAYKDLEIITNHIIDIHNRLEKLEEFVSIVKDKLIIYKYDNIYDDSTFYFLETIDKNKELTEKQKDLLEEVLSD